MNKLKKLLVGAALLVSSALAITSTAQAQVPAACTGKFYNPITDTDWNTLFPISIAGIRTSSGSNASPPLMQAMPPVCFCSSVMGVPMMGIGVTFWEPVKVTEIEKRPGCFPSLGGLQILSGYSMLHSEQTVSDGHSAGDSSNRMQIHDLNYPLMSELKMFESLVCKNPTGFGVIYVSELDPIHNGGASWASNIAPEAALFANPVATAACAVDAVASAFNFPLDALFWCAGAWGNLYPLGGDSSHTGDPFTMNNQIQAKYVARTARFGAEFQTIGPTAICSSHPNPVWVKSQYRFNQIGPVARRGRAVVTGSSGKLFQTPPVTNPPTKEYTINLIWQGKQCCLKPIP